MKKQIATLLLLFTVFFTVNGQVTDNEKTLRTQVTDTIKGWKTGGDVIVNLAQTSLTNWASGGENSVAINGLVNLFANYKNDQTAWDNTLNIGYGLLRQGEKTDFKKTDDKFDFLSKYGRKATESLYYAVLMNFRTQLTEGKNYATSPNTKISNRFAPAYLTIAAGMDYKPNSYFSAFVAPLTGKMTFVTDADLSAAGAFGVTPGEKSKSEFGGYIRVIYSKNDFTSEFMKNIGFTTKIDLFSNYLNNPQNIDVNWETLLTMKVNKYISMSLNTNLVYDDNINIAKDTNDDGIADENGPRVQFKEIFGVGFSYKF
jgi:hypothetical protein